MSEHKTGSIMKSKEQLQRDLTQKINLIRSLLSSVFALEPESPERIEFANAVASALRAILFGDRKNKNLSLIHRVGLADRLYFPLYSPMGYANVLPTYNLLQFKLANGKITVEPMDVLFSSDHLTASLNMSFESWLNEIVIDIKLQDVEPLSRLLIVKIIADQAGSHVDDTIDPRLYSMSQHALLPVVVRDGVEQKQNLEMKARTIFSETVLGIAQELTKSYRVWKDAKTNVIGPAEEELRVQVFVNPDPHFPLYKFAVEPKQLADQIYSYNSNPYYECSIYSKPGSRVQAKLNGRYYSFVKIDYKEIKAGKYLGVSLYGRDS